MIHYRIVTDDETFTNACQDITRFLNIVDERHADWVALFVCDHPSHKPDPGDMEWIELDPPRLKRANADRKCQLMNEAFARSDARNTDIAVRRKEDSLGQKLKTELCQEGWEMSCNNQGYFNITGHRDD